VTPGRLVARVPFCTRTDTYSWPPAVTRPMESVLTDAVRDVLAAASPEPSPVQAEMAAHAEEIDFPVVGPEVGALLGLLTRAVGAERVFEFGSGFGYSAYWFAEAVPEDGEVVLTEIDADELELARGFLADAGLGDRAAFEHGDAFEVFDRYDGPFDVVLVDCEKRRYPDAIDPARGKLAPGGLVIADNALAAQYDAADVAAGLRGEYAGQHPDAVSGVVEYLERMRDDPAFDTAVVPLGEGIAVSRYRGSD